MNQQFRIVKQMIDMQKSSCDGMINSLIMMWEQTATVLEGAPWFPEEGRRAFRQWVDMNKSACESLKGAINTGYSNLDKFFGAAQQESNAA